MGSRAPPSAASYKWEDDTEAGEQEPSPPSTPQMTPAATSAQPAAREAEQEDAQLAEEEAAPPPGATQARVRIALGGKLQNKLVLAHRSRRKFNKLDQEDSPAMAPQSSLLCAAGVDVDVRTWVYIVASIVCASVGGVLLIPAMTRAAGLPNARYNATQHTPTAASSLLAPTSPLSFPLHPSPALLPPQRPSSAMPPSLRPPAALTPPQRPSPLPPRPPPSQPPPMLPWQPGPYSLFTGWDGYRFGDMFLYKCRFQGGSGVPHHLAEWPDSLVSRYVRESDGCDPDYDVMTNLIRSEPLPDSSLEGDEHFAVVHVRVGDVIESHDNLRWAVPSPDDDWDVRAYFDGEAIYTDEWRAVLERYVMKRRFYEDHIPTLRNFGVRKVVLVGGSHVRFDSFPRSSLYVDLVRDTFRASGFQVMARLGQLPDEDVVFLARARYLIQSGGGFAALTGALCRRLGGTVLCSNSHYSCNAESGWGHVVLTPPSPPSLPPPNAMDAINRRFLRANEILLASRLLTESNFSTAGVLVSSFEVPDRVEQVWQQCDCSDRLSSTLIRPGFTTVWSERGQGGFIIRPTAADTAVRCMYHRDGHSINSEDGCHTWCHLGEWKFFGCAHRPDEMVEMLRAQDECCAADAPLPQVFRTMEGDLQRRYNEIVLSRSSLVESQPAAIEAIFMHAGSSAEARDEAINVHASFVRAFHLRGHAVPPLLVYDGQRVPPFTRFRQQDHR